MALTEHHWLSLEENTKPLYGSHNSTFRNESGAGPILTLISCPTWLTPMYAFDWNPNSLHQSTLQNWSKRINASHRGGKNGNQMDAGSMKTFLSFLRVLACLPWDFTMHMKNKLTASVCTCSKVLFIPWYLKHNHAIPGQHS